MTEENKEIIAYKGFDKNWKCRGYQYEIGKTYEHEGKVEACKSGFHSCEYPLDILSYYAPSESKFALVKASGEISKGNDDSKIASTKITIEAELNIPALVQKAVDFIMGKINWTNKQSNTGNWSAATNTGYQSAATNTGYQSVATNTGYQSVATNTGDQSVATNTGYQSVATNTGNWSAATNTGDQSAATNTGYQSVAEVSGEHSIAASLGEKSKARAGVNGAIVCVYRNDDGELIHIRASKVGENGIKPDTWYTLNEDGEFIEVNNERD